VESRAANAGSAWGVGSANGWDTVESDSANGRLAGRLVRERAGILGMKKQPASETWTVTVVTTRTLGAGLG